MLNNTDLTQWPYNQMKSADSMSMAEYQTLYPEIFYHMQPYIVEACDQMDACGGVMPTKEMLRIMGDGIEKQFEAPGMEALPGALRSRGMFRDLLDILLLNELFGRRRRRYY